jgi:hypothetical protein
VSGTGELPLITSQVSLFSFSENHLHNIYVDGYSQGLEASDIIYPISIKNNKDFSKLCRKRGRDRGLWCDYNKNRLGGI